MSSIQNNNKRKLEQEYTSSVKKFKHAEIVVKRKAERAKQLDGYANRATKMAETARRTLTLAKEKSQLAETIMKYNLGKFTLAMAEPEKNNTTMQNELLTCAQKLLALKQNNGNIITNIAASISNLIFNTLLYF